MIKISNKHIKFIVIFALLGAGLIAFWFGVSLIPPSEQKYEIAAKIQSDDTNIGQLEERPSAGRLSKKTIAKNIATASAETITRCQLSFSVAPESKVITPGGIIKYKISLKNIGGKTCQSASFSIYYGDNEMFKSSVPMSTSGGYYWVAGDLLPGGEHNVHLSTAHVGSAGSVQIKNEACATAYNGSDVCVDNLIFAQSNEINPPLSLLAPSNEKEFGTWVWSSPKSMSDNYVAELLNAALANKINALYITIDDYLDIAILPAGQEKERAKKEYFEALYRIIIAANARGIKIDAEGGAKDWAIVANRWKGYTLIDFVKEYNKKYPNAKIRNFQYDVEPYLLNSYERNKATTLKSFIEFIDESIDIMQGVDAGFSIVVPHFYDSTQKWTPSIVYNGETNYVFSHLLNVLEKKQGSAIIIMAYRNFFYGDNSTRQISEPEIKEASKEAFSTKIIVAQETGNVDPNYVTFYGLSRGEFFSAISSIYDTFSSYKSFGGAAAHYIDSFLMLKD